MVYIINSINKMNKYIYNYVFKINESNVSLILLNIKLINL